MVGLGNPGSEYQFTRHNIGFRIVDSLAYDMNTEFKKTKSYYSLVSKGMINNQEVMLVKPQTFMNLSGRAVNRVISYYKASHQDLLIVYDDLNLELGQLRIRKNGSAGGHKGMESIIQYLNTENLPRLRIGIGNPSVNYNFDCSSYVLSNFKHDEEDKIEKVIQLSTEAIKAIIEDDLEKAMRKYNRKFIVL